MQASNHSDRLSYQEKSLWGLLVVDGAVYALYLLRSSRANSLAHLAAALFTLIVGSIVMQTAIAVRTRNHLQDERDALIRLRGYRAGYNAYVSFAVVGLGVLWMHTVIEPLHTEHMAIHFLSVMFGMIVLADIVRIVTQLIAYRRAA